MRIKTSRASASSSGRGRRFCRRGDSAFTLLELMVVVTIIAVLTGLLSTALNQTKARGRQISCLNNIRQLQVSWFLYQDDNADSLPLNRTAPGLVVSKYIGKRNSTNSWVAGNPREDVNLENIKRGSIFQYAKSADIYRCPADRSTVLNRRDILRTRSFSMSAYMNGDAAGDDPRVKVRASELLAPSPDTIFVFVEEHPDSAWDGAFNVLPKERFSLSSGSWMSTPADRHNQGCNLSFADGHVERWRWLTPKKANLQNKPTTAAEFKDLRRLQDCVPQP